LVRQKPTFSQVMKTRNLLITSLLASLDQVSSPFSHLISVTANQL
jgi:hypothetical protein